VEPAVVPVARAAAGAPAVPSSRLLPILFGSAIFWSAALLFWVEPLVSKQLLPLLGGSPGVWNTCLVFFQAMLLAGYAFAHAITRLDRRRALLAYLAVLALAAAALAAGIAGPAIRREPGTVSPIPWVLLTLVTSIGLPFFALAATGPTLQRWFSLTAHPSAADPYFLYAASNLGSMLGLLAFPLVLEPLVTSSRQTGEWSAGFLLLLALAAACAAAAMRWPRAEAPPVAGADATDGRLAQASKGTAGPNGDAAASDTWVGDAGAGVPAARTAEPPRGATPARARFRDMPATGEALGTAVATAPTWLQRTRWLFLAFVPSSLLLGVTTYMSTDVAAVPLLWILPLALYLATFTLVFARRPPIPHRLAVLAAPVVVALWLADVHVRWDLPFWSVLLVQLVVLFVSALACHGELARTRPPARYLTGFYLWVSLGGVLGGAFNALLAPMLFTGTVEYPLAILLALLALPARPRRLPRPVSLALDVAVPAAAWGLAALLLHTLGPKGDWWEGGSVAAAALVALPFAGRPLRVALALAAVYVTGAAADRDTAKVLYAHRDFYGRIRVLAIAGGAGHELLHGTTLHGKQNLLSGYRRIPLTYYSRHGPVGQAFEAMQTRVDRTGRAAHVAVVGLGAGTLAAYARPRESWTFYDINPAVVRIARDPRYFTYVTDAAVRPGVVLGDARLRLRSAPPFGYDLIALDAFSSDAVPVHLLTREAIALYLRKLAPGGLLLFNISNRFLNLEPVLAAGARDLGLAAWYRDDEDLSTTDLHMGFDRSEWVVLARDSASLGEIPIDMRWAKLPATRLRAWTDDFSGLVPIIEW
jgi:SAM-dependent methyltransferase